MSPVVFSCQSVYYLRFHVEDVPYACSSLTVTVPLSSKFLFGPGHVDLMRVRAVPFFVATMALRIPFMKHVSL